MGRLKKKHRKVSSLDVILTLILPLNDNHAISIFAPLKPNMVRGFVQDGLHKTYKAAMALADLL